MVTPAQRSDKRRLKRHELAEPVNVYDRTSKTFLGRLVDIHTQGLLIMGNFPFDDGKIYQLELHLPEPVNEHDTIRMGVDCLWTRGEDSERAYWAGCKIIDISDEAMLDVGKLIRQHAK